MVKEKQPDIIEADAFIASSLRLGERNGVGALDENQRLVFLVSEAKVCCDMNGIDTFLDRYHPRWMAETADAFAVVGATEIAATLRAITPATLREDVLLHRMNGLIQGRSGYGYEMIREEIELRLAMSVAKS